MVKMSKQELLDYVNEYIGDDEVVLSEIWSSADIKSVVEMLDDVGQWSSEDNNAVLDVCLKNLEFEGAAMTWGLLEDVIDEHLADRLMGPARS